MTRTQKLLLFVGAAVIVIAIGLVLSKIGAAGETYQTNDCRPVGSRQYELCKIMNGGTDFTPVAPTSELTAEAKSVRKSMSKTLYVTGGALAVLAVGMMLTGPKGTGLVVGVTLRNAEEDGSAVTASPSPSSSDPDRPSTRSTAERLRELDSLRSEGLLTDAEFTSRREVIIGSL